MRLTRPFLLSVIISFLLFSFSGCNISNTGGVQGGGVAQGIVEARFVNASNSEPISMVDVNVSVQFSDDDNIFGYGSIPTSEDGSFEGSIQTSTERTVTTLYFTLIVDGEEYSINEDVNLNLSFRPPYDRVVLSYNVGE